LGWWCSFSCCSGFSAGSAAWTGFRLLGRPKRQKFAWIGRRVILQTGGHAKCLPESDARDRGWRCLVPKEHQSEQREQATFLAMPLADKLP
jgi:hypothetical protein